MQVKDAIRHIVSTSGKSHRQLAQDMKKNAPTYVSVMLNRGTDPKTGTMAELANVCGYDLALIPREGQGETIIIDGANTQAERDG